MSDKKDDVKKIPQFQGVNYTRRQYDPLYKKYDKLIWNPFKTAVFKAAHMAQMVATNTASNPRPKEQQDWMTKQGAKIKQALDNEASVKFDEGIPSIKIKPSVTMAIDSEKKREKLGRRKGIGVSTGTMDWHGKYNPDNPSSKEILSRITGETKTGKPIKDQPGKVIQLGMKKDDKK